MRRTQYPDKRGRLRAVVFVEPTEVRYGPPRPNEIRSSLLPGDQLIMVNGRPVESMGREELLRLIQVIVVFSILFLNFFFIFKCLIQFFFGFPSLLQNSENTIELTVRAMPELAELCDRHQKGARDSGDSLMLPVVGHTFPEQVNFFFILWVFMWIIVVFCA